MAVKKQKEILPSDRIDQRRILRYFFLILLVAAGVLFVRLFWSYLPSFLLAIVLVGVFWPVYEWLRGKMKGKPNISAFLMCVVVVLVVLLPLAGLVTAISKEAFDLYLYARDQVDADFYEEILANDQVEGALGYVQENLGYEIDVDSLKASALERGKDAGLFLYEQGIGLVSNVFNVVVNFLLMIFIMFYLFRDGERIRDYLMDLSPLPQKQERGLIERFSKAGSAVFYGNIVNGLIQGVVGGIGFAIFGLGGAFLWGAVMALFGLIPLLGSAIIYVPAAIYLFLKGEVVLAVIFLIYNIVLMSLVDNYVKPKLMEKGMKTHQLLVFFGVLGGINAFGILGVLYGPLIITVFLGLLEIYRKDFRKGKQAW